MKKELISQLPGTYRFEPKVNGWRALIHVPTLSVFNRFGKPFTTFELYEDSLNWIWEHSPFEWLDCEMLARRHALDAGRIIVLDWASQGNETYIERREAMIKVFPFATPSGDNAASMLIASCLEDISYLWENLQEENERLNCEYYEGIVGKRIDSVYESQMVSPKNSTASWLKWRFDQYTQQGDN